MMVSDLNSWMFWNVCIRFFNVILWFGSLLIVWLLSIMLLLVGL